MLFNQRHVKGALVLALLPWFLSAAARAQDLSDELIVSFPPTTVRIEFADLGKLRGIPGYSASRERYRGAQLATLEHLLTRLDIQESAIEQIVLAWQPIKPETGGGSDAVPASPNVDTDADGGWLQNRWPFLLDGLAAGRFDLKAIARHAKNAGISPNPVNGYRIYCTPPGTSRCVVFLTETLAAFGNRNSVVQILEVRSGRAENLIAAPDLVKLLENPPSRAAIWGAALGPGMADWFQGWMPGRENFKMDWPRALKAVESVRYSVLADQEIQLDVSLECTASEAAATLKLAFQGLKLFQQYAWQQQNPDRLNPLQALTVESDARRLSLKLVTGLNAIEDSSFFGLGPPIQ